MLQSILVNIIDKILMLDVPITLDLPITVAVMVPTLFLLADHNYVFKPSTFIIKVTS